MSDNKSEQTVALFPRADSSAGAIRELPNNIAAEQNYLGALLYDNQVFDKNYIEELKSKNLQIS